MILTPSAFPSTAASFPRERSSNFDNSADAVGCHKIYNWPSNPSVGQSKECSNDHNFIVSWDLMVRMVVIGFSCMHSAQEGFLVGNAKAVGLEVRNWMRMGLGLLCGPWWFLGTLWGCALWFLGPSHHMGGQWVCSGRISLLWEG